MTAVLTLPEPSSQGAAGEGAAGEDSLFFVGNATVLIRCGGFTVLTDPTFVHRHESVPLGYGLSTTRLTDPAVDIADLPPLDLVLLSHLHGDHFDQVAQRDLDKDLPIVTTPQSAQELQELGFHSTHALGTWDQLEVRKGEATLRITACPGRHGPGVTDLVLPDVMGSVLEFAPDGGGVTRRLYVSGDTLLYDDLEEIPRRFPDIDVGLFHLGGTTVLGIMVTMVRARPPCPSTTTTTTSSPPVCRTSSRRPAAVAWPTASTRGCGETATPCEAPGVVAE